MSKLNVELTDEHLGGVITEAILKSLDGPTREAMIRDAITYLTNPQDAGYSGGRRRPSPIKEAFYRSCERVAEKIASEELTGNPEFAARVRELVTAATVKVFEDDRVKTIETLAAAMVQALRPKSDF